MALKLLTLTARYHGARLVFEDVDAYRFGLLAMRLVEGEALRVQVERLEDARSKEANAYYWSVVLALIAKETGDDAESLHEYFKLRFNARHLHIAGEEVTVPGSTAKLSREAFFAYVERVRQFAAEELDLVTPDPDPLWQFRPKKKKSPDAVARAEAPAA